MPRQGCWRYQGLQQVGGSTARPLLTQWSRGLALTCWGHLRARLQRGCQRQQRQQGCSAR